LEVDLLKVGNVEVGKRVAPKRRDGIEKWSFKQSNYPECVVNFVAENR
jgi:hypothetical protein